MTTLPARLRSVPSWQVTLGVALLALGFLIATQLQSEGPRIRYTTQERQPLVQTALELQARQDQLKNRILAVRARIQELEQQGKGSAALVKKLNEDLDAAWKAAGLVALEGPGLVLRLSDSEQSAPPGGAGSDFLVTARDIRTVVEELWLAGAEAVAVNGERVTVTTAILDIGGSVLVNSAYLAPPYDVAAIGPPDLYARLSRSGGFIDLVRARAEAFGIRIRFAELPDVAIPAYAGSVNLRYAKPLAPATAAPSPTGTAAP